MWQYPIAKGHKIKYFHSKWAKKLSKTLYTYEGIKKLAHIIRSVRGREGVRPFARKVGVSYATIDRLEKCEVLEPEIGTLEKLALHLGYTREELVAICAGENAPQPAREFKTADDVFPIIDQLPEREAGKVAQYIISRLIQPKVTLNKGEGVKFQLELMSQEDLADLLEEVASRLKFDT